MSWATKTPVDRANAYRKLAAEVERRLRDLREAGEGNRVEHVNLGNAIRCLKGAASEILTVDAMMDEIWREIREADSNVDAMMGER